MKEFLKKCLGDFGATNESERESWVRIQLESLPEGWRLLDAGAGEQQYRVYCSHLNYVSQDFAAYDGKGDDKGLQMDSWDYKDLDIVSDIVDIPEPDASFDAVLCTEVLEHVPDPVRAVEELARLVRPGGLLILSAPFCSLTHFSPYHFCTGFNRYFYETHFSKNGLDVIEMSPNGGYFDYLGQELRRVLGMLLSGERGRLRIIKIFVLGMALISIKSLAKNGENLSELLTFGYHVTGKKK